MVLHDEERFSRSNCPVDQLAWFVNRTLPPEERAVIEVHLTECVACRADIAVWAELRLSIREVSIQTPVPRADLFARIEGRLDVQSSLTFWLRSLFQACGFALTVCGEHLWAQARLIRRDLFWMPLCLVPPACLLVYLPRDGVSTMAWLAALLAALGMAFLYSQEIDPAREIALVTPTSPSLILGIRCCLVFGYDLAINGGLILPILAWHGLVTPAWFLANWLIPLLCLSALALLLSILVNAGTAVCVCALLWTLRLPDRMSTLQEAPWQQYYESFWHQGPLLFAIAAPAVFLTFVVLERKERFAR
jgi:Putative zinc-finger